MMVSAIKELFSKDSTCEDVAERLTFTIVMYLVAGDRRHLK